MKVIDSDTVQSHSTVMIVFYTAFITDRAVMHSRELIDLTLLAVPPLPYVLRAIRILLSAIQVASRSSLPRSSLLNLMPTHILAGIVLFHEILGQCVVVKDQFFSQVLEQLLLIVFEASSPFLDLIQFIELQLI